MIVICVYSFACAADPTVDIMKWIQTKEKTAYGGAFKIDPKRKNHQVSYLGQDAHGHFCRVSFFSRDSRRDVKEVDVAVGEVIGNETGDIFESSFSATLRASLPMIYGDLNLEPSTQKLVTADPQKPVDLTLVTKDLYALQSGFGFSYVTVDAPKDYGGALAHEPKSLGIDIRIQVDFKAAGNDDDLYPGVDKVEAYDLTAKNPYKPAYTCYLQ
jgi:hypothetical protein